MTLNHGHRLESLEDLKKMSIYLCPGPTPRHFDLIGLGQEHKASVFYISSKVTPNTAIAEHYQGPTPDQLNWNGIDIVKTFPM